MSKRRNHDAAFKARLRDRNPKGSGRMACMHPRYHPRAWGCPKLTRLPRNRVISSSDPPCALRQGDTLAYLMRRHRRGGAISACPSWPPE